MTTYAYTLNALDPGSDLPITVLNNTEAESLDLDDCAINAMTDLRKVKAITVNSDHSIEFALELMKCSGVRLLVVVDRNNRLLGLVTARDIVGEKPMSIIARERIKHEEILVGQVMTPRSELRPFIFNDIEHASVRRVIMALREAGHQHTIVVEPREGDSGYFVRGIFSITQIGRQLGMEISTDGHVQSFAEFEQLIAEDVSTVSQYQSLTS